MAKWAKVVEIEDKLEAMQVEYMYDNPVELVFKDDEMFVKMEKAD